MEQRIIFESREHEAFFYEMLNKCRYKDVYHIALVYTLGISADTREHIDSIYDFNTGFIKNDCIRDGWQTGTDKKVTRLAMNLYCGGTPSMYAYEDKDDIEDEIHKYNVDEIFCCSYAPYFFQAIKLRFPEYTRNLLLL